jgi:hypothetical protein
VLLVLLLLSITLGLSYAMVRTQNTSAAIGRNADRRVLAREAAIAGLGMAYQNMFARSWAGVSTATSTSSFSRSLTSYESFSVVYTAGDPTLLKSDGKIDETKADYKKYPYRVTLVSTGRSVDPGDASRVATHTARAIVQLIPQKLVSEPTCWSTALGYTLYQYTFGTCYFAVPFRATGAVRFDSMLWLGYGYNWSDTARRQYLQDLYGMKTSTADWRPFEGPVSMPTWLQDSSLLTLLGNMGVATADSSWTFYSLAPSSLPDNYRIYPGGPQYTVGTLPQDCRDNSWRAAPLSNPLGAYVRAGTVNFYDNAIVQGTVLTTSGGDVNVLGTNVQLLSQDLLPLYGTAAVVRLPVAISQDDLRIYSGASGKLQGMVTAGGAFEVSEGGQSDTNVTLQLKIAAASFLVYPRTDWEQAEAWWDKQYYDFKAQLSGTPRISYFPAYLRQKTSLLPEPKLVVTPDPTAARYHWNALQTYVYDYPDSTSGLSWQVVQWTDNP